MMLHAFPPFMQVLVTVSGEAALERFARERYGKSVLALAVRWVLDQSGVQIALWGARSPEQLEPLDDVMGWTLDAPAQRAIDEIVRTFVTDPVGPEFMAPPARAPSHRLRKTA